MKQSIRILSTVLALILLVSNFTFTNASSAPVWPTLDGCWEFIAQQKILVYKDANLTTRGTSSPTKSYNAYADPGDVCHIYNISGNSVRIDYPTSSGYRTGYAKITDVLGCSAPSEINTSRGRVNTYRTPDRSNSYGYVDTNDTVWKLYEAGSYVCVLYNAKSGSRTHKIGFVLTGDYNSTIKKAEEQLIDVTASFAEKTISLKSIENGKYLCANLDKQSVPAMCNKTAADTWEFFDTHLTSDGWLGLKSEANGKWLSAVINENDLPLKVSADKLQSWECFRIYQKESNYYLLAQANNKYLCVRTNLSGAPVQASATFPSTWERFEIRTISKVQDGPILSRKEIEAAASAYGISSNTEAFRALESINTKYGNKLSSSDTLVFLFEGVGSTNSTSNHMNAMCVVVKQGEVAYLNRSSSTIPDYPFNPVKNGGDDMPTIKSGIYNFTTVNHRGNYAALNVSSAKVVRFSTQSSFYDSTSYAINVHRRSTDAIASPSASWVNSAGCQLVGTSGTGNDGEYAHFIQAVGIVGSSARGDEKYTYSVTGKIIIDRTYAADYLSSVGYTDAAIKQIG